MKSPFNKATREAFAKVADSFALIREKYGWKYNDEQPVLFKYDDATIRETILAYQYQENVESVPIRSPTDWGKIFKSGRKAYYTIKAPAKIENKNKLYREPNKLELQHVIQLLSEDPPAQKLAKQDLENLM